MALVNIQIQILSIAESVCLPLSSLINSLSFFCSSQCFHCIRTLGDSCDCSRDLSNLPILRGYVVRMILDWTSILAYATCQGCLIKVWNCMSFLGRFLRIQPLNLSPVIHST